MNFQTLRKMAREKSRFFPPLECSSEDGLLGVGGSLDVSWLLDAYTHGIFPWPVTDSDSPHSSVLAWWSTQPRGVFEWERIHVPRRLLQTLRSEKFELSCDTDFEGVMRGCGSAQNRSEETWVNPEMIQAYTKLHRLGFAHSVEVRLNGKLCAGVYGVALNGLFAAESMFYTEPNASKVALVRLLHHLYRRGYVLLDIQMLTDNTERFGAVEISREEYLRRLRAAMDVNVSFGHTLEDFPKSGTVFFGDSQKIS